jgi:alkylmercury lyase
MHHPSLDVLSRRLQDVLHCTQQDLCCQIMQQVAQGKPVTRTHLQAALHISPQELEQRLARLKETEVDQQGNILGWGVTLVPTSHRFVLDSTVLYTWCAFDTLLFPPRLQREASVQSSCPTTYQSITFVATASGKIRDLAPASSVMSLIIPSSRQECTRDRFCQQSLFFQSEEAALPWMASHPEAVLLSVEEAARLGHMVAKF